MILPWVPTYPRSLPALGGFPIALFCRSASDISFVQRTGLPAVYEARVLVDHGGLMSYGPNINEAFRRAASYADRLLRGARPAELPIERPSRFELVINLKKPPNHSAWEVPPTLLARADEVIE
jgi:ABC-type uncharacterized transport system substrate-binding protein